MDTAPNRPDSHNGQSPDGATPKPRLSCIRVLGERHTGTRAMIEMIEATPHLTTRPRMPVRRAKRAEIVALKRAVQAEADDLTTGGNQAKQIFFSALFLAKPRAAGWKHARLEWDDSFLGLGGAVLTQRNPYAWIVALFSRPYHHIGRRQNDFDIFLAAPWLTIPCEHMAAAVVSPAALWSEKMRAAQEFAARSEISARFLSFETFLADPVVSLGVLLTDMGHKSEGLVAIARSTKTSEPLETLQRRHADEPWRRWLSAGQVAAINAGLDRQIVEKAGYRLENPADFPDTPSADGLAEMADYIARNRTGG